MNKKATERIFVEWFIDKIGWDSCKVVDDEEPDFKVEFRDKIIGLEVTSLYKDESRKGSSFKKDESFRSKWLSEVLEKYYQKPNFPLSVQVLIKTGELKGDPEDLACELAQRSNINVWERVEFEYAVDTECKLKIGFVRLPDRSKQYNQWTFIDNYVGWSRAIDETVLRNKVEKKAIKLPKYRKKYREIILLIVVDGTYESGMFHSVADGMSSPDYGFSSVYLALYPEKYMKIG